MMKLTRSLQGKMSSKLNVVVICLIFLLALWFGFNEGFAAGQYYFNH